MINDVCGSTKDFTSFITGSSSESNNIPTSDIYIPWSDTNMMKSSRLVLNDMYNYYSGNSIIKDIKKSYIY